VAENVPQQPLRDRIIEGALWMVGFRWALRGLSVVRTVILARLLVPSDFGIFAIAMLVVQPVQTLTAFDLRAALIREPQPTRGHFDTAWTCRALQRLAVAALLFLLAPPVAAYFEAPQVTGAIRVLALALGVLAFENIGIVTFRRELRFAKEVTLNAVASFLALVVTIAAAVLLRNYWALVISIAAEHCLYTVLTYTMHPYRPRFSLSALHQLWSFSRWIPLQNLGLFLNHSLDRLLVARFFGPAPMGLYTLAGGAAALTAEIVGPVSGALYAGYAKVAGDVRRLSQAYLDSLGMLALLLIPGSIGLLLVAPTLVPVVLGDQWMAAVPIVQALALYHGIHGLSASVYNNLMASGRMRQLTALIYLQLACYAPVILLIALHGTLTAMAVGRAAVALLVAPLLFRSVAGVAEIGLRSIAGVIWRPLAAGLLMAAVVGSLQPGWGTDSLTSLLAQVAAGALSYGIAIVGLWVLNGRPAGAERTAMSWMLERLWSVTSRHSGPVA
jgi:lipopolysaccharide exporter